MEIRIEKERRKTMVIKILNCDDVVVKAPLFVTNAKIYDFVDSKKHWIEKTIIKLKEKKRFSDMFDIKNNVYLNGKLVGLADDVAKNNLKKYYQQNFYLLEEMVKSISAKIGLGYKDLKMCNSVRIWGSYNSNGVMKLNWKLIIIPQYLAEYVIIHELCHSKQMNHSAKFWNLVGRYRANYKHLKKELEQYSFVLKDNFSA